MKKKRGFNGVSLPTYNTPPPGMGGSDIIENLYKMEYKARVAVAFDSEKCPLVDEIFTRSSHVLELLKKANLHRGSVRIFQIQKNGDGDWYSLKDAPFARLNWFLHVSGYKQGFRGWRIDLEEAEAGIVLWKSSKSLDQLFQIISASWEKI